MDRFHGRIVVVLGGNSGIGLACAKAFVREGATVVITGRNPDSLGQAVGGIGSNVAAVQADVTDLSQLDTLYSGVRERFGRIDILFANQGVLGLSTIDRVTEQEWDRIQNTNLKGVFFAVQKALPLMSRGAAIVLTGSTAARKGIPTASVYASSKAGLCSLGRSFAAELVDRGIRVNVVSPGPTDTPIFNRADSDCLPDADAIRRREVDGVPMKRLGTPSEIAAAVLFLASEAAAFVTGADLVVSGGAACF